MKTTSLSILCAVLLLGGCTETPPKEPQTADQLTLGKVQGEIKVGLSSAQVVEILGSPNMVTTDEQRREVWVYDKISTDRMNASRSSYGTLIVFGGRSDESQASSRQRTLTIVIKFDDEKKVRDFAYNYTQF
jgi:outer membrane protein assembly factor BamE (lipoprotein component of BamABCDE complex)